MRIGFTGTRGGMTEHQRRGVKAILRTKMPKTENLHHGDCVGADSEVHDLAIALGIPLIVHPPVEPSNRAFRDVHRDSLSRTREVTILEPKPYLERNHDIVDATDVLIAAPSGEEQLRSGTWATIRYARKSGKEVWIVMPSGEMR